jgi:hypothetical protein
VNRVSRILLVAALAVLWMPHARAASVALLQPASDTSEINEALFRLKGELLAVGLEVTITDRPPERDTTSPEARAWLERMANERGFAALLDVMGDPTPVAVDVWLDEPPPPGGAGAHPGARRALGVTRVAIAPDTKNRAETLAIRALEVLRSRFVVLDWTARPPPSPDAVEPPRTVPKQAPREASGRFGVEAGLSARTSLDGVGPLVLPLARFDWSIRRWLALRVTGAASVTGTTLETEAGRVHVAQQFGLLGLSASPASGSTVDPLLALASGALHTVIEGEATAPHRGHRVDSWAFVVDASAGVNLRFSARYFLTLAAHAQLAAPRVAIHVVDEVVATVGGPTLLFTLTLGAWL